MGKLTSRNNNVARICNHFGWRKPTFLDPMTGGYRMCTGYKAPEARAKVNTLVEKINRELNIKVTARVRRGYGYSAGKYDLIIPYNEEGLELIDFQYK